MPGAITNAQINPQQSYMDFTHDTDPQSYQNQVSRGFSWTGNTWAPTQGQQQMAPGTGFTGAGQQPYQSGGVGGGGGGFGSSSMFGGTSFGGSNPFATDAAAAKLRDEFARMRKRQAGSINENSAAGGTFSSGVRESLMNDAMTQLDLGEGAGLESLFNNAGQQQLAFQLEQQRMQMEQQARMYGQGSQRFGNANQNQQMQSYYNSRDRQNAGQYQDQGPAHIGANRPIGNTTTRMTYGSPEWHAEQARIKAIIDARNQQNTNTAQGAYTDPNYDATAGYNFF